MINALHAHWLFISPPPAGLAVGLNQNKNMLLFSRYTYSVPACPEQQSYLIHPPPHITPTSPPPTHTHTPPLPAQLHQRQHINHWSNFFYWYFPISLFLDAHIHFCSGIHISPSVCICVSWLTLTSSLLCSFQERNVNRPTLFALCQHPPPLEQVALYSRGAWLVLVTLD